MVKKQKLSAYVECPGCGEVFKRSYHPNDLNRDFPHNAKTLGLHSCEGLRKIIEQKRLDNTHYLS